MGQEYKRDVNVVSTVDFTPEPWLVDDFEGILRWEDVGSTDPTAQVVLDTNVAFTGKQSLLIDTGDTSPGLNDEILIEAPFPTGPQRYIDISFLVRPALNGSNQLWQYSFTTSYGGNAWVFKLLMNTNNNNISYYDENGTPQNLTSPAVDFVTNFWQYIRLIVDADLGQYKYLIIGDKVFDLDSAQAELSGTTDTSRILGEILLRTLSAAQATMNIDNMLIRGQDNL